VPDKRPSLLPISSMRRARTTWDVNVGRVGKEKEKGMSSPGFGTSVLGLKKYYGKPSLVQRCTAEKGGVPMVRTEGVKGEGLGVEKGLNE